MLSASDIDALLKRLVADAGIAGMHSHQPRHHFAHVSGGRRAGERFDDVRGLEHRGHARCREALDALPRARGTQEVRAGQPALARDGGAPLGLRPWLDAATLSPALNFLGRNQPEPCAGASRRHIITLCNTHFVRVGSVIASIVMSGGTMPRLPRLTGRQVAREIERDGWIWIARPVVTLSSTIRRNPGPSQSPCTAARSWLPEH